MTHTKDEALKLALEVLELAKEGKTGWTFLLPEAINAIKEARSAPVQEPVCKECNGSGEIETGIGMMACTDCPPAAQPAPEPGLTWERFNALEEEVSTLQNDWQTALKEVERLKAAQRQWVGLTPEEWFKWWQVSTIFDNTNAEIDFADFLMIALAVQDVLGNKNNGGLA
jgi:hypothetical protein